MHPGGTPRSPADLAVLKSPKLLSLFETTTSGYHFDYASLVRFLLFADRYPKSYTPLNSSMNHIMLRPSRCHMSNFTVLPCGREAYTHTSEPFLSGSQQWPWRSCASGQARTTWSPAPTPNPEYLQSTKTFATPWTEYLHHIRR